MVCCATFCREDPSCWIAAGATKPISNPRIAITTVVEAALALEQDRLEEEKFLAVVAAVEKGQRFHEGSQTYIRKAMELVRSTLNQDPGEPSPRPN